MNKCEMCGVETEFQYCDECLEKIKKKRFKKLSVTFFEIYLAFYIGLTLVTYYYSLMNQEMSGENVSISFEGIARATRVPFLFGIFPLIFAILSSIKGENKFIFILSIIFLIISIPLLMI